MNLPEIAQGDVESLVQFCDQFKAPYNGILFECILGARLASGPRDQTEEREEGAGDTGAVQSVPADRQDAVIRLARQVSNGDVAPLLDVYEFGEELPAVVVPPDRLGDSSRDRMKTVCLLSALAANVVYGLKTISGRALRKACEDAGVLDPTNFSHAMTDDDALSSAYENKSLSITLRVLSKARSRLKEVLAGGSVQP